MSSTVKSYFKVNFIAEVFFRLFFILECFLAISIPSPHWSRKISSPEAEKWKRLYKVDADVWRDPTLVKNPKINKDYLYVQEWA